MTYTKQTWTNGVAGGTPINATRLAYIEEGIFDVAGDVNAVEADNTGASNTFANFQAVLSASPNKTVYVRPGQYLVTGTSTLTIPPTTSFIMDSQAEIIDARTGANPLFNVDNWAVNEGGNLVFRIRRQARSWDTGADTNSVGVKFTNSCLMNVHLASIQNYNRGVLLYGDDPAQGCAYNHFLVGRIVNNKVGIDFEVSGAGFTNENNFYSGVIRIDSGMASLVGTRYIDLSEPSANGNTFTNICIEGASPEKTVICGGDWNRWTGCRQEDLRTGGFHFLSTSSYNVVDGGYGNYGLGSAHFLDDTTPLANVYIGSKGMLLSTDSSSPTAFNGGRAAYEATPFFSNADVVFRTRNTTNNKTWEADAGGSTHCYASGETFPRLRQDPNSGPGGYGSFKAGRGNVAPDAQWGRASGNGAAWLANCPIASSSGTTAQRPDPAVIPMGSIWFDTTLGQHIYSDTVIWRKTRDGTAA